jgi:hypothetical protein
MCTFVILRRPDHAWPVVIGANRDEMMDRPWLPPGRHWPDREEIVAGQDVLAGGSWLGVNEHGVVAGILNRSHSLGPQAGRRSRGELVLEALDHADAHAAAAALRGIEPASYRPFNLVIADNRDGFWLRHADPTGTMPVEVTPLPPGISMRTSGDLDDLASPRIRDYRERFIAAQPPDPDGDDFAAWEALLGDGEGDRDAGPSSAMNFMTPSGFATLSSTLIALPAIGHPARRPRLRFIARRPVAGLWQEVPV